MTRKEIHKRRLRWYGLFHTDGLTYRQISALYGVPKATVIGGVKAVRELVNTYGEEILKGIV